MPPRNPKSSGEGSSKVFWSDSERTLVTNRAVDIQQDRPDLAGIPLIRVAMTALPEKRRRKITALQQVRWFESAVRDEVKRRADELKRAQSAMPTKIVSHEDDPYVPLLSDGRRMLQEQSEFFRGWRDLHQEWRDHTDAALRLMVSLLTEIRDEFREFNGKAPTEKPKIEDDLARTLRKLDEMADGPPKKVNGKPRIAIVGADPRESNHVSERIGQTASLLFLDTRSPGRELPRADFIILTKHVSHQWWAAALNTYGRDRVVRIATSGVESITAKVSELAKRAIAWT